MPHDPSLTLPATPESVRTARRFVGERVRACPPPVAENVVLLTSEVCTNCVVHARTGYVLRVRLADAEGGVRVEVRDDDPAPPEVTERGRGMRLLDALATDWGVERVGGEGKVVWFEVRP